MLFFCIIITGCILVISQIGIGAELFNTSATLETVALGKDVFISKVSIKSTDDLTTVRKRLLSKSLVFKTTNQYAFQLEFYYWYANFLFGFNSTLIDNQNKSYTYLNEIGAISFFNPIFLITEAFQSQGDLYQEELLNIISVSFKHIIINDDTDILGIMKN